MDTSAEKPEMENATPRRRNLRPAIFLIGIVVVAAGVFAAIMLNRKKTEPKDNSSNTDNTAVTTKKTEEKEPEKKTEEKSEEKTEKKEEKESEPEDENINGKTPQNLDEGAKDSQGGLTGVINYADVVDDTLTIRVSIDQYLETGTCSLELTAPAVNDTFGLTDEIAPSAATSSCSFDIATSLLTGGHYNIKVSVESDGKTGVIEDEVDV